MKKSILITWLAVCITSSLNAATLISGYNFGEGSNINLSAPYNANHGSGILTWNLTGDITLGNPYSSSLNLVAGDQPGRGLFVANSNNDNNGRYFQFSLDMSGYQDLVVTYATFKAAIGFPNQTWSWSNDGTVFTDLATLAVPTSAGVLTADFSPITTIDDVSTVFLRLTLSGATSASSANRFDNIQFNANAVPEPSTYALIGLGLGLFLLRRREQATQG